MCCSQRQVFHRKGPLNSSRAAAGHPINLAAGSSDFGNALRRATAEVGVSRRSNAAWTGVLPEPEGPGIAAFVGLRLALHHSGASAWG